MTGYDYTDQRAAPASAELEIPLPEIIGFFGAARKILETKSDLSMVLDWMDFQLHRAIRFHPYFPASNDGESRAMIMASEASEMYHAMTHYGRRPTKERLSALHFEAIDTAIVCLRAIAKDPCDIDAIYETAWNHCGPREKYYTTLAEMCARALDIASTAHRYSFDPRLVTQNATRLLSVALEVAAATKEIP